MPPEQASNGISSSNSKPQLPPGHMQEGEFVHTTFAILVPNGVTPEQLMDPGYLAHYAQRLKPYDQIVARWEDGTRFATYLVLECSRTWARLYQLSGHLLTTSDVSLTQAAKIEATAVAKDYEVKHRGPRGWSVVRLSDKQVLRENDQTKANAEKWLAEHLKGVGRPVPATA